MRKSEHTELAATARIAVYAGEIGVNALSYGNAAKAAHLSKGGLQRLFPSAAALRFAVLEKIGELMQRALFREFANQNQTLTQSAWLTNSANNQSTFLLRWLAWILGERLAQECALQIPELVPQLGFALPAPCAFLASLHLSLDPSEQALVKQIYTQTQSLAARYFTVDAEQFERLFLAAAGLRAQIAIHSEPTSLLRLSQAFLRLA